MAWSMRMCTGRSVVPTDGARGRALEQHAFEWPASARGVEWRVCGDWRWVVQVRRQICFPLRRDPSCSNLTTALRDVPSLSSKPASRLIIGRLVKKLGLASSGDRLNVWGSLSHRIRHTRTLLHEISAELHWELTALTNQRALLSLVRPISSAPTARRPHGRPFDPDDPTM